MLEAQTRELARKKLRVELSAGVMPASTNATVGSCFLLMGAAI